MSHHSDSSFLGGDGGQLDAILGLRKELEGMRLGATGQFPDGQLAPHDEGEIRFAIAADPSTGKVLIDFGKPVRSLGLTAAQASDLADLLVEKSLKARGIS